MVPGERHDGGSGGVADRRLASCDDWRRRPGTRRRAVALLSLAAVLDAMSRGDAARIGGMDRQTLRDWMHRFNAHGPDELKDSWSKGNLPRLGVEQQPETTASIAMGEWAHMSQSWGR